MITKKTYLEMKKLVANYESEQLNKQDVINCVEQPYLEVVTIKIDRKYNPKYGDDRKCKCGHPYYRHFDSYEQMEAVGCKYCECYDFEEALNSVDSGGINKYFEDLDKWENSFYCNECGCDKITDFAYDRTVANGQVWHCKRCKTETVVGDKPDEDNY